METSGIAYRTSTGGADCPPHPSASANAAAYAQAAAVSRSAGARSTSGTVARGGGGGNPEQVHATPGRLVGGHRASEPIYLDMDLPSPSPSFQQQYQQQQKKQQKKRKSFPKLENLTPPVFMTEEKKVELKEYAEARIEAALKKSQAAWDGTSGIFDDPKGWKLHVTKPNLACYRRRNGPGSDQSISTYRPFVATGRVANMTLADVEYGLYVETTPDERAANAFWFSDFFLDAAVLEAYETQTEADPFHFFGTKWLLTGTLGGVKVMSPRDSVYIQYCKTVISERGEKVLVRFVHSVPEEIVPLIPDQGDLHFVRSEISIVYMYHYDPKAKEVQVFAEGKVDPAGRSPSWMANLHLSLFAPIIVNIEHIADAKYISKHGLMFPHDYSPTNAKSHAPSVSTYVASPMAASRADSKASNFTASWVPDHQRKACFVCFKSFSIVRRHRHHCRMCGEVMCSKCMVTLPLVAPPTFDADKDANFPLQNQPANKKLEDSNQHGFPVVNMFKFCKKCILAVRQERRAMVAGVGNYYFNEGMMRHYEQMRAGLGFGGDNQLGEVDGFEDEDEEIEDDEQYSQRIEKLRQEHMEREKQKNLARQQQQQQQQMTSSMNVNVRLFDENAIAGSDAAAAAAVAGGANERKSDMSAEEYNFDNLLAMDSKRNMLKEALLKSKSDSDRTATNAAGLPPSGATATNNAQRDISAASHKVPLLPIDVRRRSFSIPDHFEKMERSIAEQEALLSTIKQERAKVVPGDGPPPRLPIGAAMQSLAISKTSSTNQEVDHSNAPTSMSNDSE